MKKLLYVSLLLMLTCWPFAAVQADDEIIAVLVSDEEPDTLESPYSMSAPKTIRFEASFDNIEERISYINWKIYEGSTEDAPIIDHRYLNVSDGATEEYTFTKAGTFYVELTVTYTGDTEDTTLDPFTVIVQPSAIKVPNAFSPNGDGINDVFRVMKDSYQSITEFRAVILNRWGNKLYEWTDIDGGWDGTYHGSVVKDGVYFVVIKAKGADGVVYNIRKDVNVLTGYRETTSSSTGN
jgi:gliding motility-associated-like protein